MSQHDFNIANQSGQNFRADLNNALEALASTSSGTSAPTTTRPYMFWTDTSGSYPVLKIRNAADSGWITLGRIDIDEFNFRSLQASNAAPATPQPYMLWIDTNTTPILKIRNAANNAWITLGKADTANLGMMPTTGGTFSAFIDFSNTDYIKIPRGTTAQRPGSPANGMLRYNTDLNSFEGYKNGSWGDLGGGSGGSSLNWEKLGDMSPVNNSQDGIRLEGFDSNETQEMYLTVNVPASYIAGLPIKLKDAAFFAQAITGNVRFRAQTALLKSGTTVLGTYSNINTSSNTSVSVPGTSNQMTSVGDIDLSDSTGKINGVSVAAGDKLRVRLYRDIANEGTSASGFANLMINNLSVTFN